MRHKFCDMRYGGEVGFENFEDFIQWAEETGYDYGMRLVRIDKNGPFSRDNCKWVSMSSESNEKIKQEMAEKWERGVGPIREKLRPQIDAQIRKQAIEAEKNRHVVWRYPHPDLVKEGIVFAGSGSM